LSTFPERNLRHSSEEIDVFVHRNCGGSERGVNKERAASRFKPLLGLKAVIGLVQALHSLIYILGSRQWRFLINFILTRSDMPRTFRMAYNLAEIISLVKICCLLQLAMHEKNPTRHFV
jgi:hypothetical protein